MGVAVPGLCSKSLLLLVILVVARAAGQDRKVIVHAVFDSLHSDCTHSSAAHTHCCVASCAYLECMNVKIILRD